MEPLHFFENSGLIEEDTNSGICSTPTARPCGPTISAKQAVKYPVPAKRIMFRFKEKRKVKNIQTAVKFYHYQVGLNLENQKKWHLAVNLRQLL
jgi:hypothetical protein